MNDSLRALLAEAVRDTDLPGREIPSIDLYLDQILNLFAGAQQQGAAHFSERQLTKTMINNYSKDGLIMPVKGRKYNKEHIVQMLLVYTMKNTLSMTEIKRVLNDLYEKKLPLPENYDQFLDAKADDRSLCIDALDAIIAQHGYDMDTDEGYFKALLEVCTLSDYFRCMAQAMLIDRYPDPEEKTVSEKDAKATKAQKKAAKAAKAQKKAAKQAETESEPAAEAKVEAEVGRENENESNAAPKELEAKTQTEQPSGGNDAAEEVTA